MRLPLCLCAALCSPRVDSASRVALRVKAPDATKVRVNFWSGPKADMVKQADGFRTFTTPPLAPGLQGLRPAALLTRARVL